MSDRDAFLRAIAADPADDTVRLAFADWLDEHGEADRAEFIRLQIKRERSGRKLKNPGLPPREDTLLKKHEAKWLGPLAGLKKHEGFECTFRRGFVGTAAIYGRLIEDHADTLRDSCPAMTELDVIGVRGFGGQIAKGLPSGIRKLRLEDWPFPDDAKAIAKSPNFAHLESLSFWLGSENDEAVCRAFGASHTFPALQQLELIQVQGGLDAEPHTSQLDARSDRLAKVVNTLRKSNLARITRPCSELLPLAPYVGRYLHGGTVPDGRQVLIRTDIGGNTGQCLVFFFDTSGNLLSGETIDVTGALRQEPDYRGYNENELYEFLAKRISFRSGMIHVHEFDAEQVIPDCETRLYKYDGDVEYFISCADIENSWDSGSREDQLQSVRYWMRQGNFCITHGGDAYWAGTDGTIHTT